MDDSYWIRTTPDAECPLLTESLEADVAIIGGGLTGLHAALKILEDSLGKKVVLIEADRICSDASGRTMGKVTTSHSRIYAHLSASQGKAYAAANKEGFDRILKLIEAYDIDCDLRRVTNYIFASTDERVDLVRKDFEAMRRSGLNVEWVEPRNRESQEIPLGFLAGLRHPDQAVYHPRKFALGLLHAIQSRGGIVYEHTIAMNIAEHDEGVTVEIDGGGSLEAKKAIVATRIGLSIDEPFADSVSFWRSHIAAYPSESEPIKNAYYRYERPLISFRPNRAFLLVGGNDSEAMPFEDEKHYQTIDAWVRRAYPERRDSEMEKETFFWWGEDADSSDLLPLIGTYRRDSRHTFMATGYCGWGMAKAALAGIMLADFVAGRDSRYRKYFDPWRF